MSHESPTTSCSNTLKKEPQKINTNSDENLELYIKNEKAEIELLESTDTTEIISKDEKIEEADQDDERIAKIKFHCSSCDMEEMVHYFGLEPSFVCGIKFNELTYVMRDPFQPPPLRWKPKAEYFVAVGAHCKLCDNIVCKDNECSFYYINSYCLSCVKKAATTFPLDIQQKLRKQLSLI